MVEEPCTQSATSLIASLRSREISSVELLGEFLTRQARLGPQLNAVVTIDEPTARAAAQAADEQLSAGGGGLPPLLGLPMTIKDALATKGLRSTGGATEMAEHVPDVDADVVTRIRDAGAVIFGKTNLPRWSGDVQASNEIFGTTNNPWDLQCGPGGSSGGASAAVSAGLTGADIGTDIGGSIRLPAHFAGVCGHKPSFGIVSQRGYVSHPTYALSEPDVNVIGPLGRSVDDLELILDVIAGPRPDLAPGWTLDLPDARHREPGDFRVAVHLDDPCVPVSSEVGDALTAARSAILASGVAVRDAWPEDLAFRDVEDIGLPLVSAATSPGRTESEFERLVDIARRPDGRSSSMQMRARASAMFHRDWLLMIERRESNRMKWARFFQRFDVLLAPVALVAAFEHISDGNLYSRRLNVDGQERSYHELIMWTAQFGYVGLPSTVVPIGLSPRGVPVGIQVVGPYLGDRTTLEFARYLERLLGGYQIPPIAQ